MATDTDAIVRDDVDYPDCDGEPMSDHTLQWEWIVTIKGGLDALFRDDPGVFVAGDLLWYPVRGDNKTRMAPDAMVAFGRPKGDRGSYRQWVEGDIPPQVVFEVLSPGNRAGKNVRKFRFYERFGVEEYYVFDPDEIELTGWIRADEGLVEIDEMEGWTSPRLGVRFSTAEGDLVLTGPDGKRFASYTELAAQRDELASERDVLASELDAATSRAKKLEEQLRQLGIDPEG